MRLAIPRAGWLAIGAVGGALLAEQLARIELLALAIVATGGLALVARLLRRSALPWLALGALLIIGRAALGAALLAPPSVETGVLARDGHRHEAVVVSLGSSGGGQQRVVLELQPPEPAERVYGWLPRYPAVVPSDRVIVDGRLEPAPQEEGFGEFLARSGIGYTLRSRTLERVAGGDSPIAALEQLRRTAGELLAQALPQPQAGLGAAIIVGLRDLVDRDVTADFRIAGLSHVVAISGWHVALVAGVVSALLAGCSRRTRSLLLVLVIGAYAIVAGGAPSVIRAALMATVVLLARESGRRGHASAALGLAVVLMLLVEPATIDEVGFQLSVAATCGLLCWGRPLSAWLRPRAPAALPGWLLETLAVSLAAQAATLPLVVLHFGRLSLVAPLANLVVAPLVGPAMLAAALALAGGALIALGVPALVLAPISVLGALALGGMIAAADLAASLPFASVELHPPLDLVTALAATLGLLLVLFRRPPARVAAPAASGTLSSLAASAAAGQPAPAMGRPRRRLAVAACLLSLCLLLVLVGSARPDDRLHMTVLDVGQGDAILLEGPAGGRMLVDTGPDPDRLLALLDARLPAWDRRLDLVVISHPHEDHLAGLALLLDRYRIGGVVEPGMIGPGPGDAAYRRRMAELGRQSRIVAAGDRLQLDGVTIDIHWPLPGRVPLRPSSSGREINNVSLVLDLRFGQRRLLLTGDVEQEIDPQLLAAGLAGTGGTRLDVLKVAHHGSGTATTDAFVQLLEPRVAVISAGSGNPYGHPSPATVSRLRDAGARLFRTDLDGSVEISTDGQDLQASAGGGRPVPSRPAGQLPRGLGFCPVPGQAASRRRLYNREDARSPPRRGGTRPAGAITAALAAAPFGRRGRGGRLPGREHGEPRYATGRGAGRERSAAARC